MRLQRIGQHNLSRLKLKSLHILLLLIFGLLLPICSHASFNDYIVISVKLAFLLHLASLEDLEELNIAKEIFIFLHCKLAL